MPCSGVRNHFKGTSQSGTCQRSPTCTDCLGMQYRSTATYPSRMFMGAKLFKQQRFGTTWVHSTATKNLMFAGSFGSISRTMSNSVSTLSTKTTIPLLPRSKSELSNVVSAAIEIRTQKRRRNMFV